jgi:hypothetical protein
MTDLIDRAKRLAYVKRTQIDGTVKGGFNRDVADTLDALMARIAELEAALSDIAAQKTVAENGNEMGDVEYGYDACITVARRALAKAPTP